jgi:phosphoglycolate phosphatase-like HAD superfamily hydrolase
MRQDYRLLVLDLDGTLTNSKKEFHRAISVPCCTCNKAVYDWYWPQAAPPTHRSFGGTVKMKDYITVECTRRQMQEAIARWTMPFPR